MKKLIDLSPRKDGMMNGSTLTKKICASCVIEYKADVKNVHEVSNFKGVCGICKLKTVLYKAKIPISEEINTVRS